MGAEGTGTGGSSTNWWDKEDVFLSGVMRDKLGAEGAGTGGSSIKALNLFDVDIGAGK